MDNGHCSVRRAHYRDNGYDASDRKGRAVENGKLIVIEGLDGSGKATQAGLLCQALRSSGKQVEGVSFPDYDSDSSALVKMYLNGEFGGAPGDVNAYAASSFYAVDRFASFRKNWGRRYAEGYVIIADRYTTSNMIHQCSKLPRSEWDSFNSWLTEYEYHLLGIPAPAAVIYLRCDVDIGQALMTSRYDGVQERKDIHERDIAYLRRCQEAADYCAAAYGWVTVNCQRGGELRSVREIHEEVTERVSGILR